MTAATEMTAEVTDAPKAVETPLSEETKSDVKINIENVESAKTEVINTDDVQVDPEVAARVVRQLEYYFGDRNLRKDRFMLREVTLDEGWISLETMLNFKRLAGICSDKAQIAKSVETSNSAIVVIDESKSKIRRNPDKRLPQTTDDEKVQNNLKTVYVKGLPLTLTLDEAEDFILPYGKTSYIKLRKDAESKFKGSLFVEFSLQEDCDKFLKLENVKFGDTTEPILITSRNDYFKSKSLSQKTEKNEKRDAQLGGSRPAAIPDTLEYEKGRVIKIPGLVGKETSREAIKDLFEGTGLDWVTYNKGDVEAFVRFAGEALPILEKVKVEGKFLLSEIELDPAVIEGDEEELYYKTAAQEKADFRNRKKRRPHQDGGRGRGNKRYRRY